MRRESFDRVRLAVRAGIATRARAIVRAIGALVMLIILAIAIPMMPQILKGKDPQEMIGTMFKMIVAFGAVGVAVVIIGLIAWHQVQRGRRGGGTGFPTNTIAPKSSSACPVCGQPWCYERGNGAPSGDAPLTPDAEERTRSRSKPYGLLRSITDESVG